MPKRPRPKTIRIGTIACLALLAAACRFDPSGLAAPDAGAPDGGCGDPCAPRGAVRCALDRRSLELCAPGLDTCLAWRPGGACEAGAQCADATEDASAHCAACQPCTAGETQCPEPGGPSLERCVPTGDSDCARWELVGCEPATVCRDDPGPAACASCVLCAAAGPTCDASGDGMERCDLDPGTGCTTPAAAPCAAGMTCEPGAATEVCGLEGTAGITAPGATNYPEVLHGNPVSGAGPVSPGYLVADRYDSPAPFTATAIVTYGTGGGNAKVAIYDHDAVNDAPGNRLLPEITSAVPANAWTIIPLPTPLFLPAGTYWIAFDVSAAQGIAYSTQTGGNRVWRALAYATGLPATGGTGFTRSTSMDCTYLVGAAVKGWARATRITLTEPTADASAVAFYAHEAGDVRLAIYDGAASPTFLRWESGPVPAPAGAWTEVPVAAGVPGTLALAAGTYWLTWQWDAVTAGPGYQAGAAGDGWAVPLGFGPLPAIFPGGAASAEAWGVYLTYTVTAPPVGW